MPALPEMAAMRPSLTMVSSVATGAKPQVNRPPTSTPMNSALYASLVMSARMIAMTGGSERPGRVGQRRAVRAFDGGHDQRRRKGEQDDDRQNGFQVFFFMDVTPK